MTKFFKMLPLIVLMAMVQNVMGQLSGTYSIGASGIVPGETGNYATLSAAITALNTNGVNGPCTFYFSESKTYTEAADVALGCAGTSATNTITFKPYTGVVCVVSFTNNLTRTIDGHFVIGAADAAATLPGSLIATNYITIDGSNSAGGTTKDLTIQNSGITTQKSIFRIFGNSDNITIKNCIMINTTISGNTSSAINVTNYNNVSNFTPDNLVVQNTTMTCTTSNGGSGIQLSNSGTPTTGISSLVIQDNIISARALRGAVYCNYVSDAIISGNTISVDNQLGTGAGTAIYLSTGTSSSGTFNIYNNVFTKIATQNNAAGNSNGIIGIDDQLATPKIVNIYNNVIRGFQITAATSNSKIYGIRKTSSSTTNVYNNSFYLPELTNMTAFGSSYISLINYASTTESSPTGAFTIKNNSFFIDESSMKVWVIRRVSTGGTFTSDNNILYVNSGNAAGNVGYFNATDYATFSAWQTASSQDLNSYNTNPNYTSTTNLLPTTGLAGVALATVPKDITGANRLSPATIGAYEAPITGSWKLAAGSNDWDVPTNWVGDALPTPSSVVVIPSSASPMPIISTATNATVSRINNYGTLSVTGAITLNVSSQVINGGTITGSDASISLNGTTKQNVLLDGASASITLKDFVLNNASGATLNGSGKLNITGTFTPTAGVLATGGLLVLKSSFTGTARIAEGAGTYLSGTVTQERYIPLKSSRAWSLISSPVSQSLSAGWQQQIHITGAGTGGTDCSGSPAPHSNGFDATLTNAPSMYSYDASLGSGSRWIANTTGTTGFMLTPGTGYRLNIRGPRSAGCALLDGSSLAPAAVTLSSTGIISNAQKNLGSFTIDYPNTGTNSYVFIGNPYPSQISFSTLVADNINIGNNYAIYAPGNTAGNYAYWDPIGGTYTGGNTGLNDATGNIIASGQAIFVRAQPLSTLTLNFNEAQKTASTQNGYFRTRSFNEMIRVAYMLDDSNKADEIIVRYANDNDVSNTKVGSMDIVSMNTGTQYLNSLKGNNLMAVQTRSLQTLTTDTVALNVKSNQSGTYKLNFSDYDNFKATGIYLIDKYTNTIHNVKSSSTYSFTVDKNNAATQTNRFALVFSKAIVPTVITGIKVYPNPADKQITVQLPATEGKYTVSITDVAGKRVYQSQLAAGTQTINIAKLMKGNYVLELTDAKGNRSVEKIVKL